MFKSIFLAIFFFLFLSYSLGAVALNKSKDTVGTDRERIVISPNKQHFIFQKSRKIFHPWGMNYGHYGVIYKDFDAPVWDTVQSDFRKMKAMGANSVRVTLEYDLVMRSPDKANPKALSGFQHLLSIANEVGLYLDVTGLAGYRPAYRKKWYDTLSEKYRWKAQANFWKIVAKAGKMQPIILCYDLINEPVMASNTGESWYTGSLGGYEFCQYLTLDAQDRSRKEIGYQWVKKMTDAIREVDSQTLITVGFASWSNAVFDTVAPLLDFMCAHIYPDRKNLKEADRLLQMYKVGLPILVEETFPLSCDTSELADFMRRSKEDVAGWFGHYLMPYSFKEMKKMKMKSFKEALYRNWLGMFVRMGEEFKR